MCRTAVWKTVDHGLFRWQGFATEKPRLCAPSHGIILGNFLAFNTRRSFELVVALAAGHRCATGSRRAVRVEKRFAEIESRLALQTKEINHEQ